MQRMKKVNNNLPIDALRCVNVLALTLILIVKAS